ncbi:tetratricopeptide (TPR) repeat protein [Silvibacterium bohemicum]|uniref:Tetratricopeptide (TPR) repeat protein n=1 Tax=Silvibacterium bohemicum TaxID=1577686 RepID=A0A841JSV8_9BACT|nr:tetratricopeptide repeat protein [Silvibacterium bohemicum]MBB6143587.1 tetratricopeptide (TPR) repeat protein [Silvibacterium bohemicum]
MISKYVPASLWLLSFFAMPCLCQPAPDAQQQVETHLREAHRLLSENKPAAAIPEFKAVIALDPSNIDAHGNLGVLLFFQGNYTAAVPELREALRRKPDLWKIQALLGMGERRLGENVAARTDLEASFPQLQEQKIRIESGLELIEIYTAAEEMDKAATVVSTLRNLDPENQEVLYAAYRIHSDMAREAILSLSLVAPKSALMYQAAAHEAARRGDTAGAIQDYRQALKINPKQPGLHYELAEMLNSLPPTSTAHAEAQSEYEAALAQNPFDEKADLKLAEIATHGNDKKKAYDLYAKAVQLQPDDPAANYELAKVLLNMDEPEKAEKLLEHAVQLDPTNAIVHFRLATVYHRLKRNADADHEADEYQKYKALKEKLRDTWKDLHFDPEKPDMYGGDQEK